MQFSKIIGLMSVICLLSSCSNTQDFNVVDNSTKFSNIEISKSFSNGLRVQLETSANTTTGHSFKPTPGSKGATDAANPFVYEDSIRYQSISYDSPNLDFEYSMKRTALTVGYDFVRREHFSLALSGGASVYDYSVAATMVGTTDIYQHYYEDAKNSGYPKVNSFLPKDVAAGTVTDKRFVFDFAAVGAYIALEPRFDFNSRFAASARLTGSVAKEESNMFWMTGAEARVRFIYKPIKYVEVYAGYEAWYIANDLNSSVDKNNAADKNLGHSELTIDARGMVGGLALRF